MLAFPTNIMVLISGNNFMPKGDLWRRLLTARIDAKTDAPERRTFALDPREYVRQHRQELVAAGLTLLRGFIAAGKPRSKATPDRLASFEAWDDLIRQAVIWLGSKSIADVKIRRQRSQRPKLGSRNGKNFRRSSLEFHSLFGQRIWRTGELISRAQLDTESPLLDALDEIASERGKLNARILGRWIERNVDVRCGKFRIERCAQSENSHKAAQWKIVCGDAENDPAGGLGDVGGFSSADQKKIHNEVDEWETAC